MADTDKLNIDSIIARLLEGKFVEISVTVSQKKVNKLGITIVTSEMVVRNSLPPLSSLSLKLCVKIPFKRTLNLSILILL